ncbi:hypothetical protein PUNSTDRAFT_130770 [Punctularia strigosozonata HHB-11173 SS5]|uniref:uncharacterized protein n=1 Tax=Punctularia strigosozonata (strain HHB-11173) TaxID=741275 RepID=UPI0004417271|nr:uncharacterized protein PUNSTDRAFT_130770 [Punctularia strigosozonata HHB-11173 SS5]EIN12511.1 hypothetical protein PUNSTDRAFT_130770 [Punctularia strigosozonata HHB-11173 SS5]
MTVEKSASDLKSGYTILRIKRKRNEEPLDALVIESTTRRKKTKPGLFQFAETVEQKAWENEGERQSLQDRISALASTASSKQPLPAPATVPATPISASPSKDGAARRYQIVKNDSEPMVPREDSTKIRQKPLKEPPKVLSSRELQEQKARAKFTMYDAVLSAPESSEVDSEMEKFMPMLQDYLKINDISLPAPAETAKPSPSALPSNARHANAADKDDAESDYVYDVFYRRPMPDAYDTKTWEHLAAIGTLSGLPPSMNDSDESDSESEEEDEADEDSNDENYYKNEYPDTEESDSMSGSDDSDMFHDGPNDDDHD